MIDVKKYPRTAVAHMRLEHAADEAARRLSGIEAAGENLSERDSTYFDDLVDIQLKNLRKAYREAACEEGYGKLYDVDNRPCRESGMRIANSFGRPTIWLYGIIGEKYGGTTAEKFRDELSKIDDSADIDLHIHSEGGLVGDSFAIFQQLRSRRGKVHVIVDGLPPSTARRGPSRRCGIGPGRIAWWRIAPKFRSFPFSGRRLRRSRGGSMKCRRCSMSAGKRGATSGP